jgi:hypothetical protein
MIVHHFGALPGTWFLGDSRQHKCIFCTQNDE